jgi:tetratricopeptide (TPR) repeat protein
VSMLSCGEIADEIERNVDFLATSMRDVPERHRSLRAAFDQSWRLLTEEQRTTFAELSVFRGGFDREAAAAVAGADLRLLSELASKSLVRRPDFGRFELHELLRQYAAEKLGEASRPARERHARHYAGLLLERKAALLSAGMTVARDELRGELDNLRAALEWTLTEDDEPAALAALDAFNTFLWMHSWFEGGETLERLARTAGFDPDDPGSASDVALAAATCRITIGARLGSDPAVEALALRCVPVLRARHLEREVGRCLCALGIWAVYRDIFSEAVPLLQEGIELVRATDDVFTEAGALMDLGFAHLLMDELDAAGDAFDAANALCDKLGNPILRGYGLGKLGLLADAEERYGDALRLHLEGYGLFTSVGEAAGHGYALSRASASAFGLGEYSEALRLGRAGYEAFSESNHRWGLITALCRIGFAALALGDGAEARERFGDALERARAAEAVSLELLALSGIGACLAQTVQQERAAAILTFTLGHDQLPASYAREARPALERLEASLPPEELIAARDAAARANLDDLVERALTVDAAETPAATV